jgi:hypothetical protein
MRARAGDLPLARELACAVATRRVARILQRQEGDAAPGLLTGAQVAKAIRFYEQQPATYTFLIRLQIQDAVGVEPTATFDEPTVQAVAAWQRDNGGTPPEQVLPGVTPPPPLKIDGMAGPRTLPRMFAHGLNVKSEGLAFGQEAQAGVIDTWRTLTPKQRAVELVRLVNTHLDKAGVPPVIPDPKDTGSNLGQFDFETWQMEIGVKALSKDQPTVEQARDVVDTIYHEARHAEQWFRIAQLRAMQLKLQSPKISDATVKKRIVAETKILPDVVEKAVKDPLAHGSMQALIAQGWYDSVYGVNSAHRERVLNEVAAADKARDAAFKLHQKKPTPANLKALEQARERRKKAVAAYKELPEENDAWATGPMTGPGVTKGAPDPPAPPVPVDPSLAGIESDLQQLVGAATDA